MDKTEMHKGRLDEVYKSIQQDVQAAHMQTRTRQKLISAIEEKRGSKLIVYVSKLDYMIDYDDIPAFGAMLDSIGISENVDLLLHSGGGFGVVAEKIVEMIRRYCKTEFRVIVPNLAKSAATMIAISADRIVMGVTSELGPIDPQLTIFQGGVPVSVSAQSFVDARDRLEELTKEAVTKGEPYQPYVAQLSALNTGFIDHCEKAMDFAKDFAEKALKNSMLKNHADKDTLATEIAENLRSASTYFTHGRTISAQTIKNNPPLDKLVVDELLLDDEEWNMIFELYLRSELFLDMDNKGSSRKGKLFESASFSMKAEFPA